MDNYDFGFIVEANFLFYLFLVILVGLVYYLLYKKKVLTIIDPYFIYLLSTVFAIADVLLLYFSNSIKDIYFSSFMFSQIALLLGFFSLSFLNNKTVTLNVSSGTSPSNPKNLFQITSVFFWIFFLIQIYTYSVRGIPLLFESRLDYYNEGGGFGIMARILGVLSTFVCYLIIKLFFEEYSALKSYKRLWLLTMIFFYLVTQILSGGKSAVLAPLSFAFSYLFVNGKKDYIRGLVKKYFWRIIIALLVLVSIIIITQSKSGEEVFPLLAIFYRLIASGDVYWYVYPNDVLYTYKITANGFVWLFNDFLGFFRLISWSDLGKHPGVYFYDYHHPSDVTRGPNIRHNVFGLMYFGYYGGIIYSFFLGFLMSVFRFFMTSIRSGNIFFNFAVIYLFINSTMIEPDVTLFFLAANNLLIVMPAIILIYYFTVAFLNYSWKNEHSYQ